MEELDGILLIDYWSLGLMVVADAPLGVVPPRGIVVITWVAMAGCFRAENVRDFVRAK